MSQLKITLLVSVFLFNSANAIKTDSTRLYWSGREPGRDVTGIYSTYAFPEKQLRRNGYTFKHRIAALRNPHFISAFDSNTATREITLLDVGRGNIVTIDVEKKTILRYHRGITNKASGVVVDWKTGNVYWCDEEKKSIMVMTKNFDRYNILLNNIGIPKGLAIYPQKGLLFWSQSYDLVNSPKIMKASLSGENPTQVALPFGSPGALALDYERNKIYWVDEGDTTIYFNSFDKPSNYSEPVYSNTSLSLTDIHIYKEFLYATCERDNLILVLNKTSGQILHEIETYKPLAITTSNNNYKLNEPGPCDINNGDCEQFCFAQPPGNRRKCGCDLGLVLNPDGKTCKTEIMEKDFFLVVDSDLRWIFQLSLDGKNFSKLSLPSARLPVQVDYDPITKRVYWTDLSASSINSANIDGSDHIVLAHKNVRDPTGIALDRFSGNVYWTDEGSGTINVVKTDGTHHKTLISTGLSLPRTILLNPIDGIMWWSDWGKKRIESASMDGTKRKVLLDEDVGWVNGLAADFKNNKLYWSDAKMKKIESSDLDGRNRKVVTEASSTSHIFGIAYINKSIFWTDWTLPHIQTKKIYESEIDVHNFGPNIFYRPSDVAVVTEQSIQSYNKSSPCAVANGNCSGLCIPVPHNTTSKASDINLFTTSRVCLCGNDHAGDCDKPLNNTDVIPPSFGITCPDALIFYAQGCSKEALVNYTIPKATDNSGKVNLKLPANPPPAKLAEGEHRHQYVATDAAGNRDSCVVIIDVKVIRCNPIEHYIDQSLIKVVNKSCGTLFGSEAVLKCVNNSTIEKRFMECNLDGEWTGDSFCPTRILIKNITKIKPKPRDPPLSNSTNKNDNITAEISKGNSTLASAPASKSTFNFTCLIPILLAALLALSSAVLYKKYRDSSMPLLAALQKTISFSKDDNDDTFVLDLTNDEGDETNSSHSEKKTKKHNRSFVSFDKGIDNPSSNQTVQSHSIPTTSGYGTIQ